MQAAIHLLRKRLENNEERKDFQKVFVRHVRHSDCREMKMTVWTLRYVVAEFLEIKVSERSLKELAGLLAELGFKDRNCRVSITDFFDSVIEPKPKGHDAPKTKHLRNFRSLQIKKNNSGLFSTPPTTFEFQFWKTTLIWPQCNKICHSGEQTDNCEQILFSNLLSRIQ